MAITLDGTTGITTPGLSLAIENFSTTGNTTLGDASTDTLNVGNGDLVKDSSGRVGIGTSSPNAKLAIGVAAAEVDGTKGVRITNSGGGTVMLENGSNNDSYVGTLSASDFCFRTNNIERARIATGGNVGIGEILPTQKIHFKGSSTTYALAETTGTGTSSGFRMKAGASADYTLFTTQGTNQFAIYNNVTSTQPLTVDSSGNLGVGVTSIPSYTRLAVTGTAGAQTDAKQQITVNAPTTTAGEGGGIRINAASGAKEAVGIVGVVNNASGNLGAMTFHVYNGGATVPEYMRLDNTGNLGIGTTSPSTYAGASGQLVIYGGVGTTFTNNPQNITLVNNGTIAAGLGTGILFSANYNNSITTTYAIISGIRENATSGSSAGALVFGTRASDGGVDTERMRISSTGFQRNKVAVVASSSQETSFYSSGVGVGVYNVNAYSSCGAHIEIGSNAASGWSNMYLNRAWSAGQDDRQIAFLVNGSTVGTITSNASSTSYVTSSDYRLKHDIAPMTGALAKVQALKPCTYKWNVDGSAGDGFIAHELAEVCPTAVHGEKDAVNEDGSIKPQGVDTSFLVATLTAAIQEQQALITQLTARITALEGA
jgi:hypothetical protein